MCPPRACAYCGRPVRPGQPYEVIGGGAVHARPCLVEVADAVSGIPGGPRFAGGEDPAVAARYPEGFGTPGDADYREAA